MGLKWLSGIGKLNKFDILNRLNVTQDGTLEIDGQPQQLSGGGTELLAIKEVWSGSTNITKTFTDSMYGFDIANDGNSDLTFNINGLTITVKSGEVFSDVFEAFTSVTINTTVPYRATVKESLSGTLSPSPSPSNDSTSPIISILPASGTYIGSQQITLSSNETAQIYYTLDGSAPTTSSTKYIAPFTVSANTSVKYFGVDTTGNQSTVQSAIYTINQPDTTAPNPITNLAIGAPTTTSIPITWTISSSTDVDHYEVAYSTDGTNFTVASSSVNASSTSYTLSGLTSNTNYTIRVVAVDTSSNRSTGVTVSSTTAVATDTTPPNDVTNLSASNVTDTSLTLSWTASTSTDIASYDVYRGATLLGNTTSTTYNVSGLTASSSYTFKVASKDTSGNASTGVTVTESTIASAPTNDTTPPNITASPVGGTYTSTQSVTLSADETATIYYTIDGTDPTTSSTVYSSPISISANTTLKYFGVDSVGNQSAIQTQNYTVNIQTLTTSVTNGLVSLYDFTTQSDYTNITDTNGNNKMTQTSFNIPAQILSDDGVKGDNTGILSSPTLMNITGSYSIVTTYKWRRARPNPNPDNGHYNVFSIADNLALEVFNDNQFELSKTLLTNIYYPCHLHHEVATIVVDADSKTATVYINNTQITNITYDPTGHLPRLTLFGGDYYPASSASMPGRHTFKNALFYNRVLTTSEIATIINEINQPDTDYTFSTDNYITSVKADLKELYDFTAYDSTTTVVDSLVGFAAMNVPSNYSSTQNIDGSLINTRLDPAYNIYYQKNGYEATFAYKILADGSSAYGDFGKWLSMRFNYEANKMEVYPGTRYFRTVGSFNSTAKQTVAFTFTDDGTQIVVKRFIDGTYDSTQNIPYTAWTVANTGASMIANQYNLYAFACYRRALSDTEVSQLHTDLLNNTSKV